MYVERERDRQGLAVIEHRGEHSSLYLDPVAYRRTDMNDVGDDRGEARGQT